MKTSISYCSPKNSLFSRAIPLVLTAILACIGLLVSLASFRSIQSTNSGGFSASALFDQANVDARDGKTAQAIVGYERAHLLAPGDENIHANLNWTRKHAGLPIFPRSWVEHAVSWASPNTMALLGSLGIILLGASWVLVRPGGKTRTLIVGPGFCGLALVAASVTGAFLTWQDTRDAVVMTMGAPARIAPTTVSEVSFKLPAGGIASIRGHHGNFILIAEASGHTGWVSQSDLQPVIPTKLASAL